VSGYYDRSPVTPDEIERQGFAIEHRGYDRDQVRSFLYEVAAALRLALQGNRSTVFGPPPTWGRGQPETAPGPDLTFDNTRILRAHVSASLRQEAELDQDAEAILEHAKAEAEETTTQAEADAEELLARAEAEADELLTQAETDAEQQRDRARRVLAAAQEEAQALIAEAEARALRVLKGARQDALNHAQQVSTTLEARADQLVEAEQGTLQRLNEARRQLSKLIEELAGADPVVGPTIEILRLAVDARTTGEPSMAAPPATVTEIPAIEPDDDADHPVSQMVRAAVARAVAAAVEIDDGVTGDEDIDDLDEPDEPDAAIAGTLGDDGPDLLAGFAGLDEPEEPEPEAPAPAVARAARRIASGRGDLTELLSEIADIIAEGDDVEVGEPPEAEEHDAGTGLSA
jgi:DivIVA domain-containing protein